MTNLCFINTQSFWLISASFVGFMSKFRRNSCYFIVNNDGRVIGQCNGSHVDGAAYEQITAYDKLTDEVVSWNTLTQGDNASAELCVSASDKRIDITAKPMTVEGVPCCLVTFFDNNSYDPCYLSLPSSHRLNSIIESTDAGTWEWNIQTNELIINERWASMVGYTIEELKPISTQTWFRILHEADHEKFQRAFQSHALGKTSFYSADLRLKHKQGHDIWIRDHGKVVTHTEEGEPEWFSGTHIDITQQKELELELLKQSRIDSLTGLANRRYFIEQIERAISRSKRTSSPLSLLIIDVDLFKRINDQFGHSTGDRALERLAKIMSEGVRSSDLVARIGGEEFAIMLPDTSINDAFKLAETIKAAVNSEPIRLTDIQLSLSITIGVSSLSDENETWSSLYSSADNAMYRGKKDGRNRVFMGT
jgi:diguanylate cyclase (GGDEF)-like protein/PAS domain S-box-containing protein